MKWALIVLLFSSVTVSFQAEAGTKHKAPKRKVVVISFSESDSKPRGPASIDEQREMEAESRHMARLSVSDAEFTALLD